jgi:glycosyltransferase involved in cell wall biosynthesis
MKSKKFEITLFLGMFNAEKYLDSLFEQIVSQDTQDFKLLLADNDSKDHTYLKIQEWKKVFGNRIDIVQNKNNLGAYGSLFSNLNKVKTEWFCWIHQDDYYKPNHVSTLLELITRSKKDVVGVSTTMGSMSSEGIILNSKPRPTWFSYNLDQAGQFLQNLKSQSVPDPSSAYRLNIFKKVVMPIHSTAFPDTEHTLRLLGYGRFMVSQKETMFYRENPESISHIINAKERELGATVALIRVFSSPEFKHLLGTIESNKRSAFVKQLLKALKHRIFDYSILQILEIYLLEEMISYWGYKEKDISKILFKKYTNFASHFTLATLNNLSDIRLQSRNHKLEISTDKKSLTAKFWNYYFQLNLKQLKNFNKIILILVYKFVFCVKPNHRLKTKWY